MNKIKLINNPKSWDDLKNNSDLITSSLDQLFKEAKPKTISEVILIVSKYDKTLSALPNPNYEGQYCQLIIHTAPKHKTWGQTSMSISEYNLFQ